MDHQLVNHIFRRLSGCLPVAKLNFRKVHQLVNHQLVNQMSRRYLSCRDALKHERSVNEVLTELKFPTLMICVTQKTLKASPLNSRGYAVPTGCTKSRVMHTKSVPQHRSWAIPSGSVSGSNKHPGVLCTARLLRGDRFAVIRQSATTTARNNFAKSFAVSRNNCTFANTLTSVVY